MPSSFDDILEQAVRGDGEALAPLLESYAKALRRSLTTRMPARWRAVISVDDIMQETYIDAFLDIRRFEPRGEPAFRAWLETLARRNLTDAIRMLEAEKRGRGRRRIVPASPDETVTHLYEQAGGTASTPSRVAARDEAGVRLRRALEQLPETYRRVVQLYDLDGRPVDDVATLMNRSPGAVFMLRARALRQIGEIMGTPSQFLSGTT